MAKAWLNTPWVQEAAGAPFTTAAIDVGPRNPQRAGQKRETRGAILLLDSLQGIDAEHGGFGIVKVHQFNLIG